MDDFCWLTGPDLCGKLNFNLPVIEVLAMAAVSGFVTWATIYFSVRQARKETNRVLADAVKRELRGVVSDLASSGEEIFRECDIDSPSAWPFDPRAITADSLIRTSGLSYANDVATWTDQITAYALFLKKRGPEAGIVRPNPFENVVLAARGPAAVISKRLSQWLEDPQSVGAHLKQEGEALQKCVHETFHRSMRPHPDSKAVASPSSTKNQARQEIRSLRRGGRSPRE